MNEYICYKKGYKYQLVSDYITHVCYQPTEDIETLFIRLTKEGELSIKRFYAWDGASGPTIDSKSSMRGSLKHDAGYQLIRLGYLDREIYKPLIDQDFYNTLLEDGMDFIRAKYWYDAVVRFGRSSTMPSAERSILIAP